MQRFAGLYIFIVRHLLYLCVSGFGERVKVKRSDFMALCLNFSQVPESKGHER